MITVLGIGLCCAGVVLIIYSNIIMSNVLDEVNAKSLPNKQFGPFGHRFTSGRILANHRAQFPESLKRRHLHVAELFGVALFFIGFFVALLGFSR
jgi:hypothetical protein